MPNNLASSRRPRGNEKTQKHEFSPPPSPFFFLPSSKTQKLKIGFQNNNNNARSSPAWRSTSSPLSGATRSGPATGSCSLLTSRCLLPGSPRMLPPRRALPAPARSPSSSSSGRSPGPATRSGSPRRSRPSPIWAPRSSRSTSAVPRALGGASSPPRRANGAGK